MESYVSIREPEVICKMYVMLSKKGRLQNSVYYDAI